ncbi:MAG: DUF2069 domain-containing protein [Neisseriaceae bacterium]|nr:DUF2069 domain-containing protein [Neisseriaceae bacterium]
MTQRQWFQNGAIISLIALIVLCFLWEWKIAPIRENGSWLLLKVLPLCIPFSGCLKGKKYTFQYSTLLIVFYLLEGVMRLTDRLLASQICAALEMVLSLSFFIFCLLFIRSLRV